MCTLVLKLILRNRTSRDEFKKKKEKEKDVGLDQEERAKRG